MVERKVTILGLFQDQLTRPLAGLNRQFKGIGAGVQNLNRLLGPLTGKLTAFAAAFVSVRAARQSIDLAREQVQQERRLLQRLGGRRDTLKEILDLTTRIQSQTTIGDEKLIKLTNQLLASGVAASDIPKQLQATIDTAAALQQPVDQVLRTITAFQTGSAGRLAQLVPELKELQERGLLASKGVEVLLKLFSGSAADEAKDSFGQLIQVQNLLGDEQERIGKQLVKVQLAFTRALLPAVEKFADFISGPRFGRFTEILESSVPTILKIGAGIASIILALTAFSFIQFLAGVAVALGTILFNVTLIVGQALLIPAVLLGITILVLDLFGLLDDAVGSVTAIGEEFGDIFDEIKKGNLSVKDLFFVVKEKLGILALQVKTFVIAPVTSFFTFIYDSIAQTAKLIVVLIGASFKTSFAGFKIILLDIQVLIGKLIDEIVQTLIGLKIPGLSDNLKVLDQIGFSFERLAEQRKNLKLGKINEEVGSIRDSAIVALNSVENTFETFVETNTQLQLELEQAIKDSNFRIAEHLRQQIQANIAERLKQQEEFLKKLQELGVDPRFGVRGFLRGPGGGGEEGESEGAKSGFDDFFEGFKEGGTEALQTLSDIRTLGKNVGASLSTDLATGLVDTFIEGKQSFGDFLRTFLAGIAKMIAQTLLLAAIRSAFGIPAIGAINTGGQVGAGGAVRRAEGGPIPGGGPNRDSVHALLTPREWVIQRPSSDYYGRSIMSAINSRAIPRSLLAPFAGSSAMRASTRFATGGEAVSAVSQGSAEFNMTRAVVVSDEQSFDRLQTQGQDAFLRNLRQNQGAARAALGI